MTNNQVSDSSQIQNQGRPEDYKEYKVRFVACLGYFLVNLVYNTVLSTFNPINSQVSTIYDVSPIVVSMNTLMANLFYLPMTFVAAFVMQKFGLRFSLWLSAGMMIVAVWIRLLINNNYYSVLGAHIILAMGLPFHQNMLTILPSVWFKSERRNIVTQVLMLSSLLGNICSNILPGIWMGGYDSDVDSLINYKVGRNHLYDIMSVEAYIATGVGVLGCILFLEKPPTPPSPNAVEKEEPYSNGLKELFRNKNYLLVMLSFGLFSGTFQGCQVVLSYILNSYGFGSEVTTYCNNILIITGIIGIIRVSKKFKKDQNYKKYLLIGCVTSIAGYVIAIIVLPQGNKPLLILPYILIGMLSLQAFPIYLSLSSEVSYPVPLSISGGFMQGSQQLLSFITGEVFSAIMTHQTQDNSKIVYIISIVIYGLCLLCVLGIKIELRRTEAEKKQKVLKQDSNSKNQEMQIQQNAERNTAYSHNMQQQNNPYRQH